jgi:hypothetical protein
MHVGACVCIVVMSVACIAMDTRFVSGVGMFRVGKAFVRHGGFLGRFVV